MKLRARKRLLDRDYGFGATSKRGKSSRCKAGDHQGCSKMGCTCRCHPVFDTR